MTTSDQDSRTADDVLENAMAKLQRVMEFAEHSMRTGDEGAAHAALARAEAIMLKYSIDAATVAARRASGGEAANDHVVQKIVVIKGIYRTALAINMHALLSATGVPVKSFTMKLPKEEQLFMVGFESEVRQLVVLVASIQLQAISSLNNWWQRHPDRAQLRGMDGYKERRQYVASFVRGATERLELARQTAMSGSAPGTELVLRQRHEPIDAYVAANFRLTKRRSNLSPGRQSADAAGREAGRRANTGEPTVSGGRRQITSGG